MQNDSKKRKKVSAHDALFKVLLGRKDAVRDFIRIFLPDLAPHIDMESIRIESTTFVTKQLEQHFSDLVASAKTKHGKALIVFLYEHKSYKDKYLLHQLRKYILQIDEHYISRGETLPVTVPIVLYHGRERFVFPNYHELYSTTDEPFWRFIPKQEVVFLDLHTYGQELLKKAEESLALMALIGLLKNVFSEPEQMLEFMENLISKHKEQLQSNKDILEMALKYIGSFRKFAETNIKQKVMEQIAYEIDYEPGSMIDQWVKEGIKKGLQLGREEGWKLGKEEGWKQGIEQGLERSVKRMLEKGFTVEQIVDILGVSKEFVLKVKQKHDL